MRGSGKEEAERSEGVVGDGGPAMRSSAYKNYLLLVLLLILTSNYLERVSLGLVLQGIKVDLRLSDTQLGLLTGLAFAAFYAVMGIPIARWGDRGNRVAIISITIAVWSVAVASCGLAANFVQLLLIRVVVAVGEAGCIPLSHSLIADYFSRAERPRAIGRYMLGAPLSYFIGYLVAGHLNELYGWRVTFMVLGLPGLALAALAWLTLREPRLEKPTSGTTARVTPAPDLRQVSRTLWSNITFRHMLFSYSVASLFGYGVWQWKPAFFIRSYGLGTVEVGTWFSVIYGVCGLLGMYWGGELASRRAANKERLQLQAMAVSYCSFSLISAAMYVSPNQYLAFVFMGLASLGLYMSFGPMFAMIQTLVPPNMRAMALAIIYLFANLIGMGLGPLAVGALSDALRPSFGEESLRYALLGLCPGYLWAGWHLWRASKSVERDLQAVHVMNENVLHEGGGAARASS